MAIDSLEYEQAKVNNEIKKLKDIMKHKRVK